MQDRSSGPTKSTSYADKPPGLRVSLEQRHPELRHQLAHIKGHLFLQAIAARGGR